MESTIKYRRFKSSDLTDMEKMFCKAFELESYSNDKNVMHHILANYIYTYLQRESYVIIAECNSKPVGFLIGNYRYNIKKKTKIKYFFLKQYHRAFLTHISSGKKYFHCKSLIQETDKALIKSKKSLFDSELILFVVDDSMQGRGVGTTMLQMFKKYLLSNGGQTLYLYTDDYSNVNYYRKMSFKEEDSRRVKLEKGEKAAGFYLFSIPVSDLCA